MRGKVGETLTAGDYEVVIASMDPHAERPDRFTNPKAGNQFVKFEVTVTNRGAQHLPLAAGYFTLKDSGGVDNSALPGVPSDKGIKLTSLNPAGQNGSSLSFPLYFEMASNLAPRELVFAPFVVGWRTRVTIDLGR